MDILGSLAKPQYLLNPLQALKRLSHSIIQPGETAEVRLPWGSNIRVNPRETVGRSIWNQGLYDLVVSESLWRLLREGDFAVDAGANIGYMSHLMAHGVGSSGKVVSFEPHPAIYRELQYNIAKLSGLRDVGPVCTWQVALSGTKGQAMLAEGDVFEVNRGTARIVEGALAARENTIQVSTAMLDDFLDDRKVAVIKIDVEGHDLQLLQGADKALSKKRLRNIVYEEFEAWDKSEIHELLMQYGYVVYALGRNLYGPILSTLQEGPKVARAYETPNYLATAEPERIAELFARRGWYVLSQKRLS